MSKFTSAILLVCFIPIFGFAQSKGLIESLNKQSVDSSAAWLRVNTTSEKFVNEFHEIGLKTLQRGLKTENDSLIAEIHESLASWHAYNGFFSPDSVVLHAEKALSYHLKGDDKKRIADTYRSLSIDYLNTGQLDKAQEVIFKAIDLYEELGDDSGLGSAYRTLGVQYRVMSNFEKSISYTNQAIPLLKETENYSELAIAQFNLIIGYGETGEFEKAYAATEYCLEIVRTKVPEEIFVPVRAYSYRGEVYTKAKDYENALKDYIAAWELCKEHIGKERCATYRTEIGHIYLLQENYKEAQDHLLAGVNAYDEKGQIGLIQPYLDLAETYIQLGDYKNALEYKDRAYNNSKNLLEGEIANIESEMAIKYETGKKDEALQSQAALIDQKNKTQLLFIVIASLLLIFLLSLLYFFYKSKKATRIIRAKNAENELLLKEIHHRVKNNLEMVKSLIALQSAQIEDPATKDAMIASQNRVQSMGIIHQKLYQGTNLGSIEMKDYFLNLSEGILDSFNAEERVKIECAMDKLELDVDTAVPIGLIVNELLTNALKYAFPERQQGVINISLEKDRDQNLKLEVKDNGVGKTEGLTPKGTGFGSQLVKLLTQQLNGSMLERNNHGTHIKFDFQFEKSA
ncbi:histidine kinase dimerization/phosphoacceptor domain -containing protein [Gramella sp. MAR_2010_147]|uniref:sensor histidine kinase n=1 Tax=Gramella sp. MAR_2010_147 TaxID=1250205 RepID=UPI00087C3C28|nr:histidine kinase dimerization/phosphoacceptor domain -containing protein [Gramella sp. MAR_2010_147]SDR71702.1 Two-component sensor histidine kinase, contains HisKA and HATPase domains [Gramella sp. MAR_2010_147]